MLLHRARKHTLEKTRGHNLLQLWYNCVFCFKLPNRNDQGIRKTTAWAKAHSNAKNYTYGE